MDCFLLQLGPIGRFAGVDAQNLLARKAGQRVFLVDDNSNACLLYTSYTRANRECLSRPSTLFLLAYAFPFRDVNFAHKNLVARSGNLYAHAGKLFVRVARQRVLHGERVFELADVLIADARALE